MRSLQRLVVDLGTRADRGLLVAAILLVNAAWLLILDALGTEFRAVAGVPLLDLQNEIGTARMVTPARALAQIAAYPSEARSLYWSFFILDNVLPPLTFGSLALLWANLLRGDQGRMARRLLGSAVVLVPLGVGAFDWLENLAYVHAISRAADPTATTAIWIGLVAKWIKAAFLQATFLLTLAVVVWSVVGGWRRRRSAAGQSRMPRARRSSIGSVKLQEP
jgi:hypothetical protein